MIWGIIHVCSTKVWEGSYIKVQSSNFRSMHYNNIDACLGKHKKNSRLECRRLYVCEYFSHSPPICQFKVVWFKRRQHHQSMFWSCPSLPPVVPFWQSPFPRHYYPSPNGVNLSHYTQFKTHSQREPLWAQGNADCPHSQGR